MAKKIQINEAGREELAELPGIGLSTADTLIKLRDERGGFKSVDELEEVPGIGAQTLQSLRSHVTVTKNGAPARKPAEQAEQTAKAATERAATNGEAAASKVAEATRAATQRTEEVAHEQIDRAQRTLETGAARVEQVRSEVADAQHDVLGAVREAQAIWFGLVQEQVSANVQVAQKLALCRTPQDFTNLQVEYLRGSVERLMNGSARAAAPAAHLAGTWWSPERWQQFAGHR